MLYIKLFQHDSKRKSLKKTLNQIKDITHVTSATNDYAAKAKEATSALGQMKDTFLGASATLASFNNAADETSKFHSQVTTLTKNLGSLNQIYEVELQDANNHLKAMNKFYSNLVNASGFSSIFVMVCGSKPVR